MSSGFAGFVPPVKCSYSPVKCSYPPVECSYPPVKCSFAGGRWGSFLYRQTQDIERWRRCSRYILSPRKMFLLRFSCGKLGGGMVAPAPCLLPSFRPARLLRLGLVLGFQLFSHIGSYGLFFNAGFPFLGCVYLLCGGLADRYKGFCKVSSKPYF